MIQQELKQRDLMMTQAVQALAMDRLRSSIRSLSRETLFQSRPPIEQFAQAPLYIPNPEYMKWSNTLGKLVGTPAPTRMNLEQALESGRVTRGRVIGSLGRGTPSSPYMPVYSYNLVLNGQSVRPSGIKRALEQDYLARYKSWQEAQRMLPS
jgi:hypothetical protein